jgi:hypothetical protein
LRNKRRSELRYRRLQHARVRAQERYGLALTDENVLFLAREIRRNNSYCVHRRSNYCSIHRVEWRGRALYALYTSESNEILTFLAPDFLSASGGI